MDKPLKTPMTSTSRLPPSSLRASVAPKRSSLAAELERDPQLSTVKRKQRTQAFTSQMAQASLERQLLAAQTAKTELETKLREKDAVIERLEDDRRYLSEREKEEREEKECERSEREEEKRKADSDIRALRNSYMALREEHAELEDKHSELSRSTSHTIATQKTENATISTQLKLLQEELAALKITSEERSQAFEELQRQFDDLSAAQDVSRATLVDDDNWSVVREELHRQADYLRAVEAENAKMNSELGILRQRHATVEVLKEQKRALERRVRDVDELHEKVARLEGELAAARKEREEWASRSTDPSHTPISVIQNLSTLRLSYARLLEEHGANVALLRRRELELTEAERGTQEAQEAVVKLQEERDSIRDKAMRHEHQAELAEREVNFLKAMVASFTAEEASEGGIKVEELTSQRVQHLESLVTDYQDTIATMEKRLEDLGGDPTTIAGGRPRQELLDELEAEKVAQVAAQQALREAQMEIAKCLEKIEELEQTLFELQGEIGGGRHVPPGVRVMSMRENPAQQWADLSQAAMDRLKGENEALLKRLKELEESGAVAGHAGGQNELVPRESLEVAQKEKVELEDELKQKEKRLLRLRQVFTAKTDEFKQAIASILGVKLAFYPNGQVRVTSQFDLNAAFVFQPTGAGEREGTKMQLVAQGEGGPEELPQLMRYWVEQEQCIPGFLASVTLQLYEKRKMEEEQSM